MVGNGWLLRRYCTFLSRWNRLCPGILLAFVFILAKCENFCDGGISRYDVLSPLKATEKYIYEHAVGDSVQLRRFMRRLHFEKGLEARVQKFVWV